MLKIRPLGRSSIEARLSVCFGHIPRWKNKEVVKDVRVWCLQRLEDVKEFCYVACEESNPVGFIEFLPMFAVLEYGLNPCRASPMAAIEAEYRGLKLNYAPYPNPRFLKDVFISCLWVPPPFARRGIGRALLERLIRDLGEGKVLSGQKREGLQVYIERRRPGWDPSVDWPAGSTQFYRRMDFKKVRDINSATMIGCVMRMGLS